MKALSKGIVVAAALAAFSGVTLGAVIVSDDGAGWTVASSLGGAGWTTVFNQADSDVWGSGLPGDGTGVEFSGPDTTGIGIWDDRIAENDDFVNGGTIVGGNYTAAGVYNAIFNFYNDSASYQPAELSLYFTDGTYEWYQDLALPSGQGWTPYSALFAWGAGWYDVSGGSGTALDFANSLTSVDELGIRILYSSPVVGAQQYGFSGFQLNSSAASLGAIPEPSTYIMLSTVLMSLGFTFGRKKKQVVA